MNLLALVYTFGNPIHDIEKTTWILVVVVEIRRVLSPRRRTPSLGFAEIVCVQKNARQQPAPCWMQVAVSCGKQKYRCISGLRV